MPPGNRCNPPSENTFILRKIRILHGCTGHQYSDIMILGEY
jgi:hypothetical protein